MKFRTLLEFYNWLTISTGDLKTDFLSLCAYLNSEDEKLLTNEQYRMMSLYIEIKRKLYSAQREIEYSEQIKSII